MARNPRLWPALIAWLAVSPAPAAAQLTTATILGSVRDQHGGALANASVTASNPETGQQRSAITDGAGRYRIAELMPGHYEVHARLPGFSTAVRRGVTLTVGREATVAFELAVGEVTEQVVVNGDSPLLNTTNGEISAFVGERAMRELPLNGRDVLQLAVLQMGVTDVGSLSTEPIDAGTGAAKMAISGGRINFNNFLLDGTSVNDPQNTTPGSVSGRFTGIDAIQEFQVLTNNYSAAFGGAGGGVVNIVTKSGTNEIRGSAFDFFRDSRFDARNFFDTGDAPPFRRNQFGGSLGGPLRRNSTFLFGAYEGLRQRLAVTRRFFVPTAEARDGVLPSGTVAISPAIRPYLDLYPMPNAGDAGGGLGLFVRDESGKTREDYVTIRGDHNLRSGGSLFARYTLDDSTMTEADHLLQNSLLSARNQYVGLGHSMVLATNIVNSLRFGYNRSRVFGDDVDIVDIPRSLAFTPTAPTLGFFRQLGGLSPLADRGLVPRFLVLNSFELSNQLVIPRGSHQIKLGFNGRRIQLNALSSNTPYGGFLFGSYEAFLTGAPNLFVAPLAGADDPYRGIRQWLFAGYVQDDWRVRSVLTLNLGLRYEVTTSPTEAHGKIANLRDPLTDRAPTVGEPFFLNNTRKNFGPRLGFAWSPGDGRSSVRGGFGVFFAQPFPSTYRLEMSANEPFFALGVAIRPPVQGAFDRLSSRPGLVAVLGYEFDPPPTRVEQWNLSLQRELPAALTATAAYVGARGAHLPTNTNRNTSANFIVLPNGRKQFPVGRDGAGHIIRNPLRNPALATVRQTLHNGRSSYHALQAGLQRRFSRGLMLHMTYTWAKSLDTASDSVGVFGHDATQFAQDPYDLDAEYGRSVFDVRHSFSLYAGYELPSPGSGSAAGTRRLLETLLGRWQINTIITARSGTPFHPIITFNNSNDGNTDGVERPSWAPGATAASAVTGDPNRYFDPGAFVLAPPGQFGNVGRNVLDGPGLLTVDLSLAKSMRLRGGDALQFRVEAFNLLNRTNFALPATFEVFTQGGVVPPNAGRITRTATSSRQLQFGVQYVF